LLFYCAQEDSGYPLQAHSTNSLHSVSTNRDAAAEKSVAARASDISNSNKSEDQIATTAEKSTARASDESEDVSNSIQSEDEFSIDGDSVNNDLAEVNTLEDAAKGQCDKSDPVSSESIATFYVVI